jgi:hypothetical protein
MNAAALRVLMRSPDGRDLVRLLAERAPDLVVRRAAGALLRGGGRRG